jgi:hypothetical protein
MTISHTPDLFEEILAGNPIPVGKLEYFRARLRLEFHDFILRRFLTQENLTKAELARRIHRSPEVVNRWLATPGNWTIDTLSDLLIGMGRVFVSFDDDSVERIVHSAAPSATPSGQSNSFVQMVKGGGQQPPTSSTTNSLLGAEQHA